MGEKVIAEYPQREPGWRKFRRPIPKRRYQAEYQNQYGNWFPITSERGHWTLMGAQNDAEVRADSGYNTRVIDRWGE